MQIHIVRPGETLFSIAMQYGTSVGFLARYNGLSEPYRLAVGQALLVLQVTQSRTVEPGDTLYGIASRFGVSPEALLRINPNLSRQDRLYPGQVLAVRLASGTGRSVQLSGYAYPFVTEQALRGILPYASFLAPFTCGFTEDGALIETEDEALIALAAEYGVKPLLHLSTLGENGGFSAQRAEALFQNEAAQERLCRAVAQAMREKGYRGADVDFEFLGAENAAGYVRFLTRLRPYVRQAGGILITALAPKTSASQPGVLYEGHDYRGIGAASDAVLVMSYEWGYSYGPPMAVAPIRSVRRVLEYAVSEIPPEKILMGFPNYAYDWTLPYTAGGARALVIGNEYAPLLAAETGAQIEYDEDSQTPYFHYTARDGQTHEVWFEDPRSCAAKFRLMEELGLRGFGVWNFMRPFTACFSMLNSLYRIEQSS